PAARVVRDGHQRQIPAADVVVEDLLVLAEGDIIPADAVLTETESLLVDESALTGESVPVDRDPGDRVSSGTVVVRGRGLAVVDAVGAASAMGRIATLMGKGAVLTPLQRRLMGVGRMLAAVTVLLCAVVLALVLARGQSMELMVVTAISLVVAAVPESLPAVVTLSLALGARRMAARDALVRKLPAVETLGSVTVLATDKTGTLTEGRMAVRHLWPRDREIDLLTAGALCNDARLSGVGDPTEVALIEAAAAHGLDRAELQERYPRVAERPFDSVRKRMTTVHRLPDGRYRVISKGAPEVLGGSEQADEYARSGCRVLAVAAADTDTIPEPIESGDLPLIGLIALVDPPREAAADTIAACRRAGIRPVLITGDHPATARAVAAELGIDEVHARATPQDKLDLIQDLRDRGEILAMTGDGVNDGPALRRADIGVAMGRRGTEVARQAAALVLADDNLDTVVAAVEEGRRVYANIRRFLLYALSGGVAEIAVMLLGPFAGLALPLLPAQILWINLLTHGLPGVALGGEPAVPGAMDRPPRPPGESILGAGLWQRVLRVAVVLTVVTLGVAVWAHQTGRPWQSMAFFALGAAQLGVGIGSRARPLSLANPMLLLAVGGALLLQVAALYLPPLQQLLGTQPLAPGDLLVVCALSALGYAAIRLDRVVHRSR
ncbi:MAG: cation-translocating P-type ATPase, partial [Nonomuraea sp.]|nr:cation-translocating P-type ATPase [Nonomuraea sp.]